ncbi:MAG: hypothetical protein HYZ75_13020 [Elusimicrobia bacterium]|nr:hypothetical protein [Elusimicrobiota bacterium]
MTNDCKLRKGVKTGVMAMAIVFGAGLVMHALTNVGREEDRGKLRALGAAYEKALNKGDFTDLNNGLDANFTYTTILGNDIKSAAEFQAAYGAIRTVIGADKGGSYTVALTPGLGGANFYSTGGEDFAFIRGTSDETVVTAEADKAGKVTKKSNNFGSLWFATAHKDKNNGNWKLAHAYAMFSRNPFSDAQVKAFTAALQKASAPAPAATK